MTPFQHDPGAEMRELFFETSQELLQSLNDDGLKLERSPEDIEVVRSIRRTVHISLGTATAARWLRRRVSIAAREASNGSRSPLSQTSTGKRCATYWVMRRWPTTRRLRPPPAGGQPRIGWTRSSMPGRPGGAWRR